MQHSVMTEEVSKHTTVGSYIDPTANILRFLSHHFFITFFLQSLLCILRACFRSSHSLHSASRYTSAEATTSETAMLEV